MLVNPNSSDTGAERRDVQAAAQAIGQQFIILDASSDRDIEMAFASFVQRGAGALLAGTGAFMNSRRERVGALAAYRWAEGFIMRISLAAVSVKRSARARRQ